MKRTPGLCQVCDRFLQHVMSLGYLPPVNDYRVIGVEAKLQSWMPTDLMVCTACDLVQLDYTAPAEVVFPPSYPYISGITKSLRDNFADLYRQMNGWGLLLPTDMIIDIGSNDGTLLSKFASTQMILGVEPTDIAKLANARGIPTMQRFFSSKVAEDIADQYPRIRKHVTCSNCFAHMDNLPDIMEGILKLIGDDGVFVSESTYLMSTLNDLSYDTIYHEHLRYYSITSINNLLRRYGLEIFHVKPIPTNGGSIRIYAASPGVFSSSAFDAAAHHEPTGQDLVARLKVFADDVSLSKHQLMQTMFKLKALGRSVAGISAPSRASTVINYCRLELDYVAELPGSLKMNKCMPGTNIPVVDESVLFGPNQPDEAILFSWHIADELIPKLRDKGYKGGIILPCERYQGNVRMEKFGVAS